MSNQYRAGGTRGSGRFSSRGSNPRRPAPRSNNRSNNFASRQPQQKSQLSKLNEEYQPPFQLNHTWKAEEFYKLKLPHPHFEDEKETIQFPVFSTSDALADRALFYQEVLDIQEQVAFDGDNGPNLYYTFARCLKGAALSEWQGHARDRADDAARTPDNFAIDIDNFIMQHETRDEEELLQDQINYINHLTKPRKTKPSEFRTQLERLNKQIPLIPGADDNDKLEEIRLKAIYFSSMPAQWRKDFKKVGKKLGEETIDDLAQYFDLYYEPDASPSKTNPSRNSDQHSSNQRRPSNQSSTRNLASSGNRGRPQDNDICPIHGGHKWKDCFDNKFGTSYRAPRTDNNSSQRSSRGDSHMNSSNSGAGDRDGSTTTNNAKSNINNDSSQTEENTSNVDTNPYADDFKNISVSDEPVPQTVVEARQDDKVFLFGQSLMDTGGSRSLIARSRIPTGVKIKTLKDNYSAMSAAGPVEHQEVIIFDRICFPEFEMQIWHADAEFIVFEDHEHSAYDLIIGRDILQPLGFDFSFSTKQVTWMDVTIPFVKRNSKPIIPDSSSMMQAMASYFTESDYNTRTSGRAIAQDLEHLNEDQKKTIGIMLDDFNPMFNQVLGAYPHAQADLLLKKNAEPIHCRPFSVADKNRELFKKELNKLVGLDVLEPVLNSPWAFPTFLIPKKDNTARFVSDFRLLNNVVIDEQFPLPMIKEVLTRRQGFDWVTAIDLTSQFYHFVLTQRASKLCTITTPFGLYRYKRLPMGVKNSPCFAQAVMVSLFKDFQNVECFIDDIAIFTTGTFEEHCNDISKVMTVLSTAGFSVKPKKCFWATQSVEYLGHIIQRDGVKPQPKKVEAVLKLKSPSTPKQLRSFIGMVNYYRDFVRHRAHILTPLTAQTKFKKKITWSPECQVAFEKIKASLAQDALLSFPNPNFPFIIEPDASDYQLGSIILQNTISNADEETIIKLFTSATSKVPENFRPIAYFSRKLSSAQRNYTTLEKELLSIVESLLEYRSFLYGRKIYVFSDHRNLTFNNMKSQRALRWRLIAEEYNVTIIHRAGKSNVAADALSRLPMMESEEPSSVRQAEERFNDSYLFYPVQNYMDAIYPLGYKQMEEVQKNDPQLLAMLEQKPSKYKTLPTGQYNIIHFKNQPTAEWKIVIPVKHINQVLTWFHRVLQHPGATRMINTINRHFYFPNMKTVIEQHVRTCDICQRIKGPFPKIGQVPMKLAEGNPWEEVQVDLVGPWFFKFPPKWEIKINAITAIDPFIGNCEVQRLKNKTCAHTATKFYQMWLTRYPRPLRCIHDNGSEFIGQEFQDTLKYHGIQDVATTVKNPQANSVIERMHHTAGTIFRSMVTEAKQAGRHLIAADIDDFVDTAIASAQYAINATVHSITKTTPGAFMYQRDMMLPVQCIANWETIRSKKQANIQRNFLRENTKRKSFDWQPGMEVLVEEQTRYKLNPKSVGPFTITKVHTNGTVTIKKSARTFQRLNIRRIKPYYRRVNPNNTT